MRKPLLISKISLVHYCRCCLLLAIVLGLSGSAAAQKPNFITEEVKFENAGVTLVGTVFKPKHPEAAVVIVHGSGQEKRGLNFATLLANNGIAVLAYDKRGVGESGGVYAGPEVGTNNVDAANLNLLASDASAAINALAAHLPAKYKSIGLIGGSQAGWIIPLAAQKNPAVRFMVLFSGPVVTAREQLRFQFFTQGKTNFWDTHTEAEAREHLLNDPDRYQFADTDATAILNTLSIPGIWIFGGKDIQAPVQLSVEHLNALKALGKPYEYQVFPALGHNTAFSSSKEPVNVAIQWMKAVHHHKKQETSKTKN